MSTRIGLFLTQRQVDMLLTVMRYAETHEEIRKITEGSPVWEELLGLLQATLQVIQSTPGGREE